MFVSKPALNNMRLQFASIIGRQCAQASVYGHIVGCYYLEIKLVRIERWINWGLEIKSKCLLQESWSFQRWPTKSASPPTCIACSSAQQDRLHTWLCTKQPRLPCSSSLYYINCMFYKRIKALPPPNQWCFQSCSHNSIHKTNFLNKHSPLTKELKFISK